MANADKIFGLKPVRMISGAPYTGQGLMFYHAAGTTNTDDLYIGDPVVPSGTADAAGIMGVAIGAIDSATAWMGVVQGIKNDPDHKDRTYIDGVTAGYVYVCCDPNVIYEIQADDVIAAASIGLNCPVAQTTANSANVTGVSGIELDASEVATTATDPLKIIGIVQREDNAINSANNKVLVVINNHYFKGHTGTVGIS